MRGKLVAIAGAELRKALGNVVKPPAQLVAWRQLARPPVEVGASLHMITHSPWYVTTRPHRLLVPHRPRRKHSSCTICEWSTNRLTSGP